MTVSEVERLHEGLAPVGGTPSLAVLEFRVTE
jgi:hypothetical protein